MSERVASRIPRVSEGEPIPRLMTLPEVAEYLVVSKRTVRRLIAADDLPCVRIGSQIRFESATLLRWISARKGG